MNDAVSVTQNPLHVVPLDLTNLQGEVEVDAT
jgi:hypothetical protein